MAYAYVPSVDIKVTLKPDLESGKYTVQNIVILDSNLKTPLQFLDANMNTVMEIPNQYVSFNEKEKLYEFTLKATSSFPIASLILQFIPSDLNTVGSFIRIINQNEYFISGVINWPNKTNSEIPISPISSKTYPFPEPVPVALILSMDRTTNGSYVVSQLTAINQNTEESIPLIKDFDTRQSNIFYEYQFRQNQFEFNLRNILPTEYALNSTLVQLGGNPPVESKVVVQNSNSYSILWGLTWSIYDIPFTLKTNLCGQSTISLNYLNEKARTQLESNPPVCASAF